MRMMGKQMVLLGVVSLAASAACASRGDVRNAAAAAAARIETLAAAVEETQARTAENEDRIDEVDREVQQTAQVGQQLMATASEAAQAVHMRLDRLEMAANRLIFEVTLNEAQGDFVSNRADLPETVRARIDELVARLRVEHRNVYLEIEGHTDSTGSEPHNLRLGLERAEAVKMYLYEMHKVPLHKMNVLSFGETWPAAPNDTPEGRAQNRRVVIRVLS
jgi:outer membrane protein OmpA-like peptidoglycan-associated protein